MPTGWPLAAVEWVAWQHGPRFPVNHNSVPLSSGARVRQTFTHHWLPRFSQQGGWWPWPLTRVLNQATHLIVNHGISNKPNSPTSMGVQDAYGTGLTVLQRTSLIFVHPRRESTSPFVWAHAPIFSSQGSLTGPDFYTGFSYICPST